MPSSDLYLGIDTGGTFTDGVLLEPLTRTVVKKAKVLTTHHDLRICIGNIIDALVSEPDLPIRLVSLSTTLATNSIAEGKSRPVALFLLGYDPALVYKFEFDRQFGGRPLHFIEGRHDLNGRELDPLDLEQLGARLRGLDGQVEALAFSSYAGTRNPEHEEQAGLLAARLTKLPVVQGHHLSDTLDSIRRATTARLNAALLSTAYEFLQTVQARLAEKGIHSPLYVVKGDGSLASAGYAATRPVEMIHSGPATSAIGGSYLAGTSSALVIDVGGTTTDLALTANGSALPGVGEASVGSYRTGLQTIRAHSFGLGGDSLIRFDPHQRLTLGPERAIPLCYLAAQYPRGSPGPAEMARYCPAGLVFGPPGILDAAARARICPRRAARPKGPGAAQAGPCPRALAGQAGGRGFAGPAFWRPADPPGYRGLCRADPDRPAACHRRVYPLGYRSGLPGGGGSRQTMGHEQHDLHRASPPHHHPPDHRRDFAISFRRAPFRKRGWI